MKKLLLLSVLLIFGFCWNNFAQNQTANGITFYAPKGFMKIGDLHWKKGNEIIKINYQKGNINQDEINKKKCQETGGYISLYDAKNFTSKLFLCIKERENGLSLISTELNYKNYNYNINVLTNKEDSKGYFGYVISNFKDNLVNSGASGKNKLIAKKYYDEAIKNEDRGDYLSAINLYTKIIDINPEQYIFYVSRGNCKAILGDRDSNSSFYFDAISDFNKAIELSPEAGNIYCDRAAVRISMGADYWACKDINKAKELGYDCSNTYGQLIKLINCN